MPQGGALGALVWCTGDLKTKSREVLKEGTVRESRGERTCRKKEREVSGTWTSPQCFRENPV